MNSFLAIIPSISYPSRTRNSTVILPINIFHSHTTPAVSSVMGNAVSVISSESQDSAKENWLQRVKKWRLIRLSLALMERMLSLVEFVIAPVITDPKFIEQSSPASDGTQRDNQVHLSINRVSAGKLSSTSSSTANRTPDDNIEESRCQESSCWTPSSTTSENVFDRSSCVTNINIDDVSLNTDSTPVRDIRRKMAYKIRSWRELIRDLEGTPHFPTQCSPLPAVDQTEKSTNSSSMGSIWHSLTSWFLPTSALQLKGSSKRKRLDCDDDDLALYIPNHKGQSRFHQLGPVPQIKGLSTVPVIGSWYSPVADTRSHI